MELVYQKVRGLRIFWLINAAVTLAESGWPLSVLYFKSLAISNLAVCIAN